MFPKTCCNMFQPGSRHNIYQRRNYNFAAAAALACRCFWLFNGILSKFGVRYKAIPHNSKCRYSERGAAAAKPKAQIILDAAKVSAASGGNSEPHQDLVCLEMLISDSIFSLSSSTSSLRSPFTAKGTRNESQSDRKSVV